jgi:hypothetical protein
MLVPVKRGRIHPDEPEQDLEWSLEPARAFLRANPEIELHHMHDPNQDRLMSMRMAYFRYKWTRLPEAYISFLEKNLEPGGTIFVVESTLRWPTTKVQDGHYFQFGALGGAEPEEFLHGGPRVENYLARYGSHRKKWSPPHTDSERAEAEWGFSGTLRKEIETLASRNGFRFRRLVFDNPQALSPLIADLYRWWNQERGIVGNRLLVSSFILMEPYWTVRTGSVPYWMLFNKEPSAVDLGNYLESRAPFDQMYMILFSHGVESIGLASMQKWRSLLGRARVEGSFIGVDPDRYPRDFAVTVRYNHEIPQKITSRYPWPGYMRLGELDQFLGSNRGRYKVEIIDHEIPSAGLSKTAKPELATIG